MTPQPHSEAPLRSTHIHSAARPVGLAVGSACLSRTTSRSILIGADDLAAVARREGLIDTVDLAAEVIYPGAPFWLPVAVINLGFHELIELLMKWTEPSQNAKFAPPGCMLVTVSTKLPCVTMICGC